MIRTYYAHFVGYYPVGAVMVIRATSKSEAAALANAAIANHDKRLTKRQPRPLSEADIHEVPRGPGAVILLDGDY